MQLRPYRLGAPLPHCGNGDDVFCWTAPVEEDLALRLCLPLLTVGLRSSILSSAGSGALALRNALSSLDRAISGFGTFKFFSGEARCRTAASALPAAGLGLVLLELLLGTEPPLPHVGIGYSRPAFAAARKSSLCARQLLCIGAGIGTVSGTMCFGLTRGLLAIFWHIA